MRILLATIRDAGQIGGTSTHLDMLSRGLEQAGHDVTVLYLGDHLPRGANRVGVVLAAGALNRVRKGWGMVYAGALRGRLLARAVAGQSQGAEWDVINAQEVYSVPFLRRVADDFGLPLILTMHGYPLYESVSEGYSKGSEWGLSYLRRAEMEALRLADAIVTVDSRLYSHVLRLVPHKEQATTALPNFIDTSAFQPVDEPDMALRDTWGIPRDRIVLFCPRRLVKKNGVVYPSLALAEMSEDERRRFLLLHAGEGGERQAIEQVVAEHGLEPYVRLLGGQGRGEIAELYRMADIVLVPSVHSENVEEATSLAALEAMSTGRPLVAGAVGGLKEIVLDGSNGLLVPDADAGALRAAIIRLADDPGLRRRLAATARDYVVEHHSHLRAAEQFVQVYRTAGGRESAPQTSRGEQISLLGFPLDVTTLDDAADLIVTRAEGPGGMAFVATSFNPELVVGAHADPRAAEALIEADLVCPDGVGAVWAARRQGARAATRVAGIELAERVLERATERGLKVYLLGARPGVADKAAAMLKSRFPGLALVGCRDGYFSPEQETEVVRSIQTSRAHILLAALGAPKQEIFLRRHRSALGVGAALGVGGSFDVWAGEVKRAPRAVRRAGLEWLYRLVTEPERWRRQIALPVFAWRALEGTPDDYGPGRLRYRVRRRQG